MKTVALDIGNVCLKLSLERCMDNLRVPQNTSIPEEFHQAVFGMETGLIDENEWLKVFRQITAGKFTDNELRYAYNSMLGKEIPETADFVKSAVNAGYRVIFFSDTSPLHLMHIFRNLSFSHLITGGVYSFEAGTRKPDSVMYQEYEKRYGIPDLYLDDKPENISAAEKREWKTVLVKENPAPALNNASALLDI